MNVLEDISLTNKARDLIFFLIFSRAKNEILYNYVLIFIELLTILLEFYVKLSKFSLKMFHIFINIRLLKLAFFLVCRYFQDLQFIMKIISYSFIIYI